MCVYIQLYVWILETIYACVDWENNPQHQGDIVFSSPMPYVILQKKFGVMTQKKNTYRLQLIKRHQK